MAKNVLIISASPRKCGNSDLLCDQFMQGAEEAGHKVEKVFLRDKKIGYCVACYGCRETERCVQKDDMNELLEKLLAADTIVLATPVYFYSMDAQLKTFIDRIVPIYTKLSDKEFYFIITAADTEKDNMQATIAGLRGFTDGCLDTPVERGILYGLGLWDMGAAASSPYMQEAYEMGKGV